DLFGGERVVAGLEGLKAEPDILLGHQFEGRLVDHVAVLDRADAGFDGAADSGDRVDMRRDIGAQSLATWTAALISSDVYCSVSIGSESEIGAAAKRQFD